MIKPRKPQKETPLEKQGRDFFQTPNYATELLIPFIPKTIKQVWEPACGEKKIVNVLKSHGYLVIGSDIAGDNNLWNFLSTDDLSSMMFKDESAIITNPPYSLKIKFYKRCVEYGVPFALLISGDYSQWNIKAVMDGCEKIIPTKRIDYITPSGLSGATGNTSYFHSYWLTKGFGLGRSETIVELTKKMKDNI